MDQRCFPMPLRSQLRSRLQSCSKVVQRIVALGLLLGGLLLVQAYGHGLSVLAQSDADATHTVQPGETLSLIAQNYGVDVDELMALNGITDPDAIVVGQALLLPEAAQAKPTATPLPVHTVRAGETLSEIAQQYQISLTRLMLYNGIRDANAVYEGQELRIPPPVPDDVAEDVTDDSADDATAAVTAEATPTVVVRPTETATAAATSAATVAPTAPPRPTATATALIAEERTPPPTAAAADLDTRRLSTSLNRGYTVRSGDTLAQIALRMGVDFDALLQVNGIAASEVGNLAAGQTLILPATGADLQARTQEREYEVKPGDSLGSIAAQFDLTMGDLLTANWITNPDNIAVGQRLAIPGKALDQADPLQVGPLRRGYYFYTVQPGDTLSTLANALNTNKLAILEYNGLPDEETVYAGLEIRVPYGPPALPIARPPVPASGTSFLVSLSRQECWLFHGDRVAHAWNCSTGYGEWITRTGSFAVQSKIENAKSNAYRLDMPYWLGIYNVGTYENGIHGLPVEWDTGKKIWERLIGEPATFGCAMLDDRDAVVLFNAAYIGMPVHIIH